MQEIINAVIIDDIKEDVFAVTKALATKGISTIPVLYTTPSDTYSRCKAASVALPRVIITDIQMNTGGGSPTKTDLGNVTKCLLSILEETDGPYVILAWSSVPESFNELKEYVEKALQSKQVRLPMYFDSICKTTCKNGEDYSSDKILEKFSEHLEEQKEMRALMHWEKSVLNAASKSVNELSKNEDAADLGKTLYALASEVAKKHLEGYEAIAINESLIYVLKDKLSFLALDESSKDVWKNALGGASVARLTYEQKSDLNSILHFDDNVSGSIICPGDIWKINREDKFFEMLFANAEVSAKIQAFKEEIYGDISAEMVCMEVSPACDFSNNKKILKSMVMGFVAKKSDIPSNNALEKIKKKEDLLSIPFIWKEEPCLLSISRKYISSLSASKIKNLETGRSASGAVITKVMRMRENLLMSWIQSVTSHNSRIGTISFN